MKIVLDTDKKTITVPWNYTAKLEEINRIRFPIQSENEQEPNAFTRSCSALAFVMPDYS